MSCTTDRTVYSAVCMAACTCLVLVDGSTHAWRPARQLAYIASADASDPDGPGVQPISSLVTLQRMVRDGPDGLPNGSLAASATAKQLTRSLPDW